MTRHDKTRQDKTRQDKTRQGKTRHDMTRQDKTRQDKDEIQSFSLSLVQMKDSRMPPIEPSPNTQKVSLRLFACPVSSLVSSVSNDFAVLSFLWLLVFDVSVSLVYAFECIYVLSTNEQTFSARHLTSGNKPFCLLETKPSDIWKQTLLHFRSTQLRSTRHGVLSSETSTSTPNSCITHP